MTDNEIIKALECCNKSDNGKGCFECPYRQYCPDCLRGATKTRLTSSTAKRKKFRGSKRKSTTLKTRLQ